MKSIIRVAIAFGVMASVVGCGKGVTGGSDENAAQQRRDSKVLEQRFQQVRGTYEGTIENPASGMGALRARLILYVVNVRESANPDGSVRIRPALYGRFQLVDAVSSTDYVTLNGNYDELGELALTSVTSQGGSGGGTDSVATNSSLSLKGTIYDGVASIEVVRDGGIWGTFKGGRTTVDASAPSSGDFNQYRERLLAVLMPIEGVYMGTLEGGAERVKVSITITVGEDSSRLPILVGQYRRLDFQPGVGERQLAIKFDSVTGTMTMQGLNGGGSVPGSNYFSGTGTWSKDLLNVTLRDHRGLLGRLSSTRAPLY